MNADKEYYTHLRKAVEETVGREMKSPNDFHCLKEKMQKQLGQKLSLATLERFWGYAKTSYNPSRWTLDILSVYAGYKSFENFCGNEEREVQSAFLEREQLSADTIPAGARLRLTWNPERKCVIEHLGNGNFRIIEASGTKLTAGDTFTCHVLIQGEPLYISDLRHKDMPPVSYVAGKKSGVKFMNF